jgi:hypothetical protein
VSVDADVDGGLDVDVDLDLAATLDVQRILVSMATTASWGWDSQITKQQYFDHVYDQSYASSSDAEQLCKLVSK